MSFGLATVVAQTQSGLPVAQSCFIQNDTCVVLASYFDTTGAPYSPTEVQYRIDDVCSDIPIVDWTTVVPAETNAITVTSAQNLMINQTRQSETHQVLFKITDTSGIYYARGEFTLVRVAGLS